MKSTHKALMFQDPPASNGDKLLKMIQISRQGGEDEQAVLNYFREDPTAIYAISEGLQIMTQLVHQCTQILLEETLKKIDDKTIPTKERQKDGGK